MEKRIRNCWREEVNERKKKGERGRKIESVVKCEYNTPRDRYIDK